MPKLATLTEDFTTFSSSKWAVTTPYTVFTGGRGRLYAVKAYTGLASIGSSLDLNGSQLIFQVAARAATADRYFGLELKSPAYGGGQIFCSMHFPSNGNILTQVYGDPGTEQVHTGQPANPWVRIRDSGSATIVWEVSTDGSTWTQLRSQVWGGSLPTDIDVTWYAGGGATDSTSESYFEIDNVNLPPAATVSGTATLSSASNMTASAVVVKLGTAALSAASNLSATATTTTAGATVTGVPSSLSAASGMSTSGFVETTGSAALSASSGLSAEAWLEQLGSASLDASSGLSVTAFKDASGSASLNAASALNAAAVVTPPAPRSQNLNGWRHLMREDFTRNATLGNFRSVYGEGWTVYDGLEDTSRELGRLKGKAGLYSSGETITVHDGMMDIRVFTGEDGQPRVAAPTPPIGDWAQLYGRYEMRFKATTAPGYKIAWLLWPAEPNGWVQGEVDFPEGDLGEDIGFFSHQIDGNPEKNQFYSQNVGQKMLDWHIATIEWSPGRLRLLLDGAEVGNTTDPQAVPKVPMFWVLQTETQTSEVPPPKTSQGHVYIDYVSAWAYDPSVVVAPAPVVEGQVALSGASGWSAEGRIDLVRTIQAEVSLSGEGSLSALALAGPAQRWFFRPPSRRVRHKGAGRLVLHIQGMTVVRKGAFFSQVEEDVDFAQWDEVWLGGYEHYISKATYLALLEAGYGAGLQVLAPGQQPAPSTLGGSGYGAGRYGAGGFGLDASASSYGDGPFGPGPTTSE